MLTNDFPLPFRLPETAVRCPSGRLFGAGTREAKVWHVLNESAVRRHRWKIAQLDLYGPPGRVPAPVFSQPYCGGGRGTRSIRELRRQGFEIPLFRGGLETQPGVETKLTFYWLQRSTGEVQPSLFESASPPSPAVLVSGSPAIGGPLFGTELVFADDGKPLESTSAFCPPNPVFDETAYRRFLRGGYRSGAFAQINGKCERLKVTQATVSKVGLDPRPVLADALSKLGVAVTSA